MTTKCLFNDGVFQIYHEETYSGLPVNVYFMVNEEIYFDVENLRSFLAALPKEVKEDLSIGDYSTPISECTPIPRPADRWWMTFGEKVVRLLPTVLSAFRTLVKGLR